MTVATVGVRSHHHLPETVVVKVSGKHHQTSDQSFRGRPRLVSPRGIFHRSRPSPSRPEHTHTHHTPRRNYYHSVSALALRSDEVTRSSQWVSTWRWTVACRWWWRDSAGCCGSNFASSLFIHSQPIRHAPFGQQSQQSNLPVPVT